METLLPRLPLPRSPNKPTLGAAVGLADSRVDPRLVTDSSSWTAPQVLIPLSDLARTRDPSLHVSSGGLSLIPEYAGIPA